MIRVHTEKNIYNLYVLFAFHENKTFCTYFIKNLHMKTGKKNIYETKSIILKRLKFKAQAFTLKGFLFIFNTYV